MNVNKNEFISRTSCVDSNNVNIVDGNTRRLDRRKTSFVFWLVENVIVDAPF